MPPFASAMIAALIVSAVSLVGVAFLFARWSPRLETAALAFAAGVLLANAFVELLPEAVQHDPNLLVVTLGAFVGFFLLERWLTNRGHASGNHRLAPRYLVVIGDGLHNFVDGVAIAASFAVDPSVGIATTFAIAAHEVPQEMADYGVLVASGLSRTRALWINLATGITALVGVAVFFLVEPMIRAHLPAVMAATAGMFLYIAACDLIPELHHRPRSATRLDVIFLLVGIALILALHELHHTHL